MKKVLFATLVALAAFATACDKPQPDPVGGADVIANLQADAAFVNGTANVNVVLSAAAEAEVKATLAIASDSQLKDVTVEPSTVVIPAGQTSGKAVLTLASSVPEGEYNVKVGMTVTGAKAGTDAVTVKAVVSNPNGGDEPAIVLDFYNYKMHCNPMWEDNPIVSGSNYTMEVKFYSTHWHNYDQKEPEFDPDFDKKVYCNRLAQFCNSGEKGFLYRFGDGGKSGSLRVNSALFGLDFYAGGQDRVWDTDMWHTMTVAVDAETCKVYDNGEFVGEAKMGSSTGFKFERYEFGMSWDDGYGYPRAQDFHGYLAYIRFWTKTLTEEEIKAGLCHVDHKSEGLAAMWEFNQDGGSIVPDATGNGRDWDFSNVYDGDGRQINVADEFKAQWFDWDETEMGPLCPDFSAVEE